MPESTDRLVEFIRSNFKEEYKLIVVDNGSDTPSKYTDIKLPENINKLGGVLIGMKELTTYYPTLYWNISTSTEFIDFGEDFSTCLSSALRSYKDAVSITPGYTGEVIDKTNRVNLAIENSVVHESPLVGVYSMFDAEWLDSIGWFDERLKSTFGTDFETSYYAKQQGKKMLVHDLARVKVSKGPVYKLGRAGIDLDTYQKQCIEEMNTIMSLKYGDNWRLVLGVTEYV